MNGLLLLTDDQGRVISGAAAWCRVLGLASIVSTVAGVLLLVRVAVGQGAGPNAVMIAYALGSGISAFVAWSLVRAGASFRQLARDPRATQRDLIEGFRRLRPYYVLQVVSATLAAVLAVSCALLA